MTEDMENDDNEDELFDENLLNTSQEQLVDDRLKDARYQQEEDDVPRFGGVVENADQQSPEQTQDQTNEEQDANRQTDEETVHFSPSKIKSAEIKPKVDPSKLNPTSKAYLEKMGPFDITGQYDEIPMVRQVIHR